MSFKQNLYAKYNFLYKNTDYLTKHTNYFCFPNNKIDLASGINTDITIENNFVCTFIFYIFVK